jgi:hypothetical protein
MEKTLYKRHIEFIDGNGRKVRADAAITTCNGYPEFTLTGRYEGAAGQVFDRVRPANEHQTALIMLWREFHLKDVSGIKGLKESLDALLGRIEAAEKARPASEATGDDALLERMEEEGIPEGELEAVKAYMEVMGTDDLRDFEEAYAGEYSSDKEFAREKAEDWGMVDDNATWPNNCIDWELAARELMYDYSEQDGHYFRNL